MLSDFNCDEMASQGKILVIDDQITNTHIIYGFLMILGFKNRHEYTFYVQDGYKAID